MEKKKLKARTVPDLSRRNFGFVSELKFLGPFFRKTKKGRNLSVGREKRSAKMPVQLVLEMVSMFDTCCFISFFLGPSPRSFRLRLFPFRFFRGHLFPSSEVQYLHLCKYRLLVARMQCCLTLI